MMIIISVLLVLFLAMGLFAHQYNKLMHLLLITVIIGVLLLLYLP